MLMDLTYTDEQLEYRTQVRRFAERVLRPMLDVYDFTRSLTGDEIRSMRATIELHEIATSMPQQEDGKMDPICFGSFIEEVSRIHIGFTCLNAPLFFPVRNMFELLDLPKPANTRWRLDPSASTAEFRVPHFWGLVTVKGHFERLDGHFETDVGGHHRIAFTIEAVSLHTGSRKRDKHLRSADFFDVEKHRRCAFGR